MSVSELRFLKKLLRAKLSPDCDPGGWVEVGRINGVNPRTLHTFADAGLIETRTPDGMRTEARLCAPQ